MKRMTWRQLKQPEFSGLGFGREISMRHIAIIGSGPAGYYTAEAAQKHWGDDVCIDIFDMLPVPYGLIRFGVAPDHQSIKGVSRRYEKTALNENVHFIVCSDGPDWCRRELQDRFPNVTVYHDDFQKDLAILVECDHMILSKGTYGWWAAWLHGGGEGVMFDKPFI